MRTYLLGYSLGLGLCFLAASPSAAIQIANYSSATNDRFANDPAFVADAYDLSGVGLNSEGRWLTMISPRVYISAEHYKPSVGSTATFYSGNDPAGTSATRTLTSNTMQIGDTDLYLGTLDAPLPSGFGFYDIATEDVSDLDGFASTPYGLAEAYVLGRSPGSYPVAQDMAVGRNRLDVWFGLVTISGETGHALGAAVDAPSDPSYLAFEADLRTGDSGAPLLVDTGTGRLTIAGINWFVFHPDASYIGMTYLGNYDHLIQDFIGTVAPVPEPAAFALILAFLPAALAFSRRKRR